jgi:Holliday junction resolvase RusA-like endonuclease
MAVEPIRIVISGNPVSQKNQKRIARTKDGRPFIVSSKKVLAWKKAAQGQIAEQWGSRETIDGGIELAIDIQSYLGPRQKIDTDNLAAAPLDILEKSGVISNDYWVRRVVSERHRDVDNPRVEITLTTYEETHDD